MAWVSWGFGLRVQPRCSRFGTTRDPILPRGLYDDNRRSPRFFRRVNFAHLDLVLERFPDE